MRGNKPGCKSHGRHGRDPESVRRYRLKQNDQYRNDPSYRARVNNRQGGRKHGITPEEYAHRRSLPCEICGEHRIDPRVGCGMHVDHDHVTGALRGTLCDRCNRGLGMFYDKPERLQSAIRYLEKYAPKTE